MMTQAIWPGCRAKASATESMLLYWKCTVSAVVLGGIPADRGAVQSCQPLYPHLRILVRPVAIRASRTAALVASDPVLIRYACSAPGRRPTSRSVNSTCRGLHRGEMHTACAC